MAQPTNKLTATAVRNAKPREKTYRLADGGGMYLEVSPSGGRYWRLKYRLHGKEKRLALGVFPEVSLAEAREARDSSRKLIAQGVDPVAARRAERRASEVSAANTLAAIAEEWLEEVHKNKVVPDHYRHDRRRLELHLLPVLGNRPLVEITAGELLDALRRIERQRKLETAKRVRTLASLVFRYAIATERADRDPAADLKGALRAPQIRHHAAITEPEEIAKLMRAVYAYSGEPATLAALKLSALVFVRPGELRKAEWADVDLDAGTWSFTASKNGPPLIVPLPSQAVEILTDLHDLTGHGRYVLPGARSAARPMSENAITAAMAGMGYKGRMTAHGFRAMARTVLEERLGYPPAIIEQQLAHVVKDANGRAYNRTAHLEQRKAMLQAWADYLDALREGAGNVVPIRGQA
ncbi:tyrosine-type recombinase/integrase [Halomonas ventosae]|uniref:Integrase n=1 Tax=Halomonas ventosae TaxID=229007 RepID=A0A2T0VL86_9GAMM|nr:integrase arm-type DNA-binding domain-containing protein [Halomonas ventosae]PRY70997.1 integrase [Halomonas ventosae]